MNPHAHYRQYGWLLLLALVIVFCAAHSLQAQGTSGEIKWIRIGSLHSYFSEQNGEVESGGPDALNAKFCWPAAYGPDEQATLRSRAMWIGCKDFFDTKASKTYEYKVVGVGPRAPDDDIAQKIILPPAYFKLVGKYEHPAVVVDGEMATMNTLYDALDETDESIPADRMIKVTNHTSMGVTITKKVYAFGQQYNDNYFVYDYVLKNTGIVDGQGGTNSQTLKDFYFYINFRYGFAGESVPGYGLGWGAWNTTWGRNMVFDVIGTNATTPDATRAFLAWYGPHSQQPVSSDWGCPNYKDDGVMAAAKMAGCVVLHADKSVQDRSDNIAQPVTTYWLDSDDNNTCVTPYSQFDPTFMRNRYTAMTKGHSEKSVAQEVGDGFGDLWGPGIGGPTASMGFGPYQLALGDSVHIVMAEGVAGINREKNREVGGNWLQWFNGTGTPTLVMPDGSTTTDSDGYKKAWVLTCRDSLMQMFQFAKQNYNTQYGLPQPPPPPKTFTVNSGGDRIQLSWADNAATDPHFGGYVIYRSENNVLNPKTVYRKIFECGKADVVHVYNDLSAVRGFDYYYYIQSKDDGSQNTVQSGVPLASSMFWTVTNKAAYLRRPAGTSMQQIRVVPNPYDVRSRSLQFGAGTADPVDRIMFYGLPPACKIKVFTERGDLILEKDHTNGAGDEKWDSLSSSGQIVVSGVYILYVEATQTTGDIKAGDSVYRKFVIIR